MAWPGLAHLDSRPRLVVVFLILWTAFSFISGLAGVPYNDIVARTIPSEQRTRLLGIRLFLGGALAAIGALLIRALLRGDDTTLRPWALIFGAGSLLLALSTACFALLNESPAPVGPTRPGFRAFLRDGVDVFQHDRRFRLFLYAQLLGGVTRMAAPFYILQGQRVGRVPELEVGTLLAAQVVGGVALNPFLGWWGDRCGKVSLFKLLAGVSAVGPLVALFVPLFELTPFARLVAYTAVFFSLGASTTGEIIGDLGYLMKISPDDRRPEYTGYMNALVAPSRLLPFLGGIVVGLLSFRVLFAVAAGAVAVRLGVLTQLARLPAPPLVRAAPRAAS